MVHDFNSQITRWEKARSEMHIYFASCFEDIFEPAPVKTAGIRLHTFYYLII